MRKIYIDNIKWITVVLVVIYHVIYMFNGVTTFGVIGPGIAIIKEKGLLSLLKMQEKRTNGDVNIGSDHEKNAGAKHQRFLYTGWLNPFGCFGHDISISFLGYSRLLLIKLNSHSSVFN